MLVYGLRLLVALITFGVGVAASWLTSSGSPALEHKRVQTTTEQVVVLQRYVEYSSHYDAGRHECKQGVLKAEQSETDVVEGGILNGKARSLPAPVYPPGAKATGVNGPVFVRVTVDESGSVDSARAFVGPLMLRQAAEDAAREALFAPTRLSGRPVRVTGTLTYNFALK